MSLDELQNVALNAVETLCDSASMPVQIIIRPWYGSRYFSPMVITLASIGMLFAPLIESLASTAANLIPFAAHVVRHSAPFDLGSFSRLYFLLGFMHGIRVYRRMLHMEKEQHSRYEGPPLPFFPLLPGGGSFWRVRILYEPLAVFIAASVLQRLLLIAPSLATYLQLAAFCLAMKNFIGWYRQWEFLRNILDARNSGPIIARFVDDTASPEELSSIHLASLPKDTSPELRRATAAHIARVIAPGVSIPNSPQGESHATH
jgi:hypothetical protein